jgi:hypothetical protein
MGVPWAQSSRVRKLRDWRAQGAHGGIVARTLGAAVPTDVVVVTVAVVLAVGTLCLLVERDEIGEREAVVAGDEVDRV